MCYVKGWSYHLTFYYGLVALPKIFESEKNNTSELVFVLRSTIDLSPHLFRIYSLRKWVSPSRTLHNRQATKTRNEWNQVYSLGIMGKLYIPLVNKTKEQVNQQGAA